jgi:lipoic acid synthetase
MMEEVKRRQKPDWLKIKVPIGKQYVDVRDAIDRNKLHTICTSGQCPNKEDCWGRGTATFMILGNICTRSCKFCAVATGRPLPADWDEPARIADGPAYELACMSACNNRGLGTVAPIWAATIRAVKEMNLP